MKQTKDNVTIERGDKAVINEHVYLDVPLKDEKIDLFNEKVIVQGQEEGKLNVELISGKYPGLMLEADKDDLEKMELFDFPEEVDLGTSKAHFIAGVREWNSDYLGWAIYYIPNKEEFVVWTYNDSSGGMNGGAYCSRFVTALDNLRMRSEISAKYGLELDSENMSKYVNGKNMI